LVAEPAAAWDWHRPVETAVLAAQAELDLMRAHFRMDRLAGMPGRAVLEESVARQARWAQMRPHWLVGMAEPEEMPEAQAQVLRVWLEPMAPLCSAQVDLAELVEPVEQELTVELEELEGQARLVAEPAAAWDWHRPVETAVLAAQAELDLMRAHFRMDRLAGTLGREAPAEPVARQARWAQMRRPLLAGMAVRPECRATGAMARRVMHRVRTAALVALAAIPAYRVSAVWVERALDLQEPPRHPAATGGTEAMDLLRCSQANPAGMAELAEPVAMSATAAMGDSEEMAQSGRPEQTVQHPEVQAPMAQSAEQAVAAGPADPVAQFQATVVMVASRATAELEATGEPASQARRGRIRETLAKPEGVEAMEPMAVPEVLVESGARPLELGLQVPMGTAEPEATGEMLAWLEMVATVLMVM